MAYIEHVAVWTEDVERLATFYEKYFDATVATKYVNPTKGFESRFLKFEGGARLEIMRTNSFVPVAQESGAQRMGLTHLALSVGSAERVDTITKRLREDGYPILDGPRTTGDGYYESVTLDPDGTRVEITA